MNKKGLIPWNQITIIVEQTTEWLSLSSQADKTEQKGIDSVESDREYCRVNNRSRDYIWTSQQDPQTKRNWFRGIRSRILSSKQQIEGLYLNKPTRPANKKELIPWNQITNIVEQTTEWLSLSSQADKTEQKGIDSVESDHEYCRANNRSRDYIWTSQLDPRTKRNWFCGIRSRIFSSKQQIEGLYLNKPTRPANKKELILWNQIANIF